MHAAALFAFFESDLFIENGEHILIACDSTQAELLLGVVLDPMRGEFREADGAVHDLTCLDLILKRQCHALQLLLQLAFRIGLTRSPCFGTHDLLAGCIISGIDFDSIGIAALCDRCHEGAPFLDFEVTYYS